MRRPVHIKVVQLAAPQTQGPGSRTGTAPSVQTPSPPRSPGMTLGECGRKDIGSADVVNYGPGLVEPWVLGPSPRMTQRIWMGRAAPIGVILALVARTH